MIDLAVPVADDLQIRYGVHPRGFRSGRHNYEDRPVAKLPRRCRFGLSPEPVMRPPRSALRGRIGFSIPQRLFPFVFAIVPGVTGYHHLQIHVEAVGKDLCNPPAVTVDLPALDCYSLPEYKAR